MADAQKADDSGWGREIVTIYETFLLRDLLGYVFPGAVMLLGVGRLLFNRPSTLESIEGVSSLSWLTIALGLSAAYSVGVLLRLFGTWTHILVIAPVVGWLGDPWDLKGTATANSRSRCERVWRSPYEEAVVERYKGLYAERPGNLARLSDREDVFLHLTGTLGLALLVVGFMSALVRLPLGLDTCRPFSVPATALLGLVGIVFIAGHYRHARAMRLLCKAATGGMA